MPAKIRDAALIGAIVTASLLSTRIADGQAHLVAFQQATASVINASSPSVSVSISDGRGRSVRIDAECVIPTTPSIVWATLSDYEHLHEFVPFLTKSQITRTEGTARILSQEGRVRFLMLDRHFTVTFRVQERPMRRITFQAIDGDFRIFDGTWEMEPRPQGTWVHHTVEVEPRFFVPRWAMRIIERHVLLQSMHGVIQRCVRRTSDMTRAL